MNIYEFLQYLPSFSKHYKSILIVTKYYTNLLSNKENNERLKKKNNNFVYFRKYSHYDANFAAMNFVSECKLRKSIHMNYENSNIRKHWLRIQNAKFAHT